MHAAASLLDFRNLLVALGIGLLIGLERGWERRETSDNNPIGGLRTFAIVGITGGITGLMSAHTSYLILAAALIAAALLLALASTLAAQHDRRYGITTEFAAFAAFGLGALAATGMPYIAAAGGILITLLLGLKPELHRWLERLDRNELMAGLEILLISVVILPLLPDRGLGPWGALNPYQIWMLVVIVAAISFAGHFAIRALGENRGILLTGLLGGLASSTALTMHFAKLSKSTKGIDGVLGTGIALAMAVSIPRVILVTFLINPTLARETSIPLGLMTLFGIIVAFIVRWLLVRTESGVPTHNGSAFQLSETVKFALLIIAIMLVSAATEHLFGTWGVYGIAIVAGAGNLTAAALSIAGLTDVALDHDTAIQALTLAAVAGTLFKGIMAFFIASRRLGIIVLCTSAAISAAGLLIIILIPDLTAPLPIQSWIQSL